ncbi:DUF3857 domain-containing protein [Acidobacterium sp. S8]|uniref:DUF3857 domain-containing protein n=1 Tax=Acidobacterium sp. S8 TaxID=1641854 RepID=UPI00131DF258|nr:DUF3857 domain-containing protein [Acidobacterium sp. S8]
MTSDPAAPDAPAVFLFRQEVSDDKLHMHSLYARIKILTEKGKDNADVEIPYEGRSFSIRGIQGRTIHSDGTVIPFTGKPIEKLLLKQGNVREMAKVFSLPDVQVGSIIEYEYVLAYEDGYAVPPRWYIQQLLYVHKAHYHFNPTQRELTSNSEHGNTVVGLMYTPMLPPGAQVRSGLDGYDLTIEKVPAMVDEEYMPPMESFSYRVLFYYSSYRSGDEFWKQQGKYWSKNMDRFAQPSAKVQAVVQQIVAPSDTQEQKLRKIYAAVMQLENTSFTREHSAAENKAEGLKIKTADDIWEQKRGNSDELTLLFIALTRAAGMKAYAMAVTNRNSGLFVQSYLDWDQLDDDIAIVPLNGKEIFFDPGQRYCEFGKLHWKHTFVQGVRQVEGGIAIAESNGMTYADTSIVRFADLTLNEDGKLQGLIRITFTGGEALRWRQHILKTDDEEAKKDIQDELQKEMPADVILKTNHFLGATDYDHPLMVIFDVSGSMGTATGKRVFLPGSFFEANAKPLFVHEKRENPVDLRFPYLLRDTVTLALPTGFAVESVPKDVEIPLPQFADFVSKYKGTDTVYAYGRLLVVALCGEGISAGQGFLR